MTLEHLLLITIAACTAYKVFSKIMDFRLSVTLRRIEAERDKALQGIAADIAKSHEEICASFSERRSARAQSGRA